MSKSGHIKFPEGADFEKSSLTSLFPALENDGEFANLLRISSVGASEKDLYRVLNDQPAGSILGMTPDQIRAELTIFETHNPADLVQLKDLIRRKLRYWEVWCGKEQEVPTATFFEGDVAQTVIHDLRREVGRGIAGLFRVIEAQLTAGVNMRSLAIPGRKPVQVATGHTARLMMRVEILEPRWLEVLAAQEGPAVFGAHGVLKEGREPAILLGTPLEAPHQFGELATGELVLVRKLFPDSRDQRTTVQLGFAPHHGVRIPLSQRQDIKLPKDRQINAFLTLGDRITRTEKGFKGTWGEVVPVIQKNVERSFGRDDAALAIATSAYVGLTGNEARIKKFS